MASILGEPGDEYVECERARLMLAHEKLQMSYAAACRLAGKVVNDTGLWDRLQAESENRERAAKEAGRIVRDCVECDARGRQVADTARCPSITASRVEEWLRTVRRA